MTAPDRGWIWRVVRTGEPLGAVFSYTGHDLDKPPPGMKRWVLGAVRDLGLERARNADRTGLSHVMAQTPVRVVDVERFIGAIQGYPEHSPDRARLAEDLRAEWARYALERL